MHISDAELGELIKLLNPYSKVMDYPDPDPPAAASAGGAAPSTKGRFHIQLDDHTENYTSAEWIFRGTPQTVKKALRITYRYPLGDGFYATEHILIGYAGSNGG